MFNFLFNPYGRVSRKAYWLGYILPFLAIGLTLAVLFIVYLASVSGGDLETLTDAQIEAAMAKNIVFWIGPAAIAYVAMIWISIAVGFKRLHDRNRSGFWMFAPTAAMMAAMLPFGVAAMDVSEIVTVGGFIVGGVLYLLGVIICLWLFVVMYFLPGTRGDNRFGPNPLSVDERTVEQIREAATPPPWAEQK